jgi:hypothetical protein
MLDLIKTAAVGDDVYDDDATAFQLQKLASEIFQK